MMITDFFEIEGKQIIAGQAGRVGLPSKRFQTTIPNSQSQASINKARV